MKTRTLAIILILVLAVMIIAGSCATRNKAISIEDALKIRSGKWVNELDSTTQMIVHYPDERYEAYYTPKQERMHYSGKSDIYESWRDSEGVLWYRAHYQNSVGKEGYVLGKISNSDNTLEFIQSTSKDLMIEGWIIGKVDYNYFIYYRQ